MACIPTPGNRYLIDLKEGLEAYATVEWDHEAFWDCKGDFDVVHIHWPEYLSYQLEAYLYNKQQIAKALWNDLEACLKHWSHTAKIIYTRHNALPHARQDKDFRQLYEFIGRYAHTVVHFANFSIQQFKEWYPDLDYIKHVVIPHHNYASLPNNTTKREARGVLQIDQSAKVMLVFGGIRKSQKKLILQAFNHIPDKTKVLLAPKWRIERRPFRFGIMSSLFYLCEKQLSQFNKSKRINEGHIKENHLQYYLNAADFLFIPRTYELNSGNIALGCTFGLVVVGKDSGNIGEILKEIDNPSFQLNNAKSLNDAILKAIKLSENGYGITNKLMAYKKWSMKNISESYIEIMR